MTDENTKRGSFAKVYNELTDFYYHLPDWTPYVTHLYMYLVRKRWNYEPTDTARYKYNHTIRKNYEQLAEETCLSRPTVTKSMRTLEQYGLVTTATIRYVEDGIKKHEFTIHDAMTEDEFRAAYPNIDELIAQAKERAEVKTKQNRERQRRHQRKKRGETYGGGQEQDEQAAADFDTALL